MIDGLEWAAGLRKYVRGVIESAHKDGLIPDVSIETVRAQGRRFWELCPTMGPKGVRELEHLIGGWEMPHSETSAEPRDPVNVLRVMMDELHKFGWPSEATWADACRCVGRPIPKPLAEIGGPMLPVGPGHPCPPRKFQP